ncbi:MAG: hypothetical protein HOC33_05060 [Alphaproteobacteria bacterium]|nr:hypothetical protein [Alphaproteobacteria bacterium]MBT4543196.1 hypothetical protein [Alphaproteobacteria bacterium]
MTNLNIGASGNFTRHTKFNSKASKWFVRSDDEDVEIGNPTFVIDFPNIRTGWHCFRENQAPERLIDPSLDRAAPSPGEGFKRGFVVRVYSQKHFFGLVELSSASIHMGNAIREMFQAYETDRDKHPGELPVIVCTGSEAMKDKYGTNYKPILELVKWVPRPAEMPDQSPVDPADVWQPEAPAAQPQQQTHVQPPSADSQTLPDRDIEY